VVPARALAASLLQVPKVFGGGASWKKGSKEELPVQAVTVGSAGLAVLEHKTLFGFALQVSTKRELGAPLPALTGL